MRKKNPLINCGGGRALVRRITYAPVFANVPVYTKAYRNSVHLDTLLI